MEKNDVLILETGADQIFVEEEPNKEDQLSSAIPVQFDRTEGEAEAKKEEPKRSHLPFNVLMLKQDKQKWEGA